MMILNTVLKKLPVISIACLMGLSGVSVAAEDTSVYAGTNYRHMASYSYIGFTHNLTNEFFSEGVLLKAKAGYANYEYTTTTQPRTDGKASSLEFMLGYQLAMQTYLARAFIGLDHEDHSLTPDNIFDKNSGTDTAAKVELELETDPTAPNYGSILASFSAAKDRYRTRIRAGQEYMGVIAGLEAELLGDQEYKENRVGIFVNSKQNVPVMYSAGLGFADPDTYRGDVGTYLTFEVSKVF